VCCVLVNQCADNCYYYIIYIIPPCFFSVYLFTCLYFAIYLAPASSPNESRTKSKARWKLNLSVLASSVRFVLSIWDQSGINLRTFQRRIGHLAHASAIIHQPSAISHQPSALSHQPTLLESLCCVPKCFARTE
jgi:hypothetical protein